MSTPVFIWPSLMTKMPGNFFSQLLVRNGDVLPGVCLNSRDAGDVGRQSGGMNQRCARARQVLHAEEHLVLLRDGAHQQRLCLSLARLQSRAGVAHLACKHQHLLIRE